MFDSRDDALELVNSAHRGLGTACATERSLAGFTTNGLPRLLSL